MATITTIENGATALTVRNAINALIASIQNTNTSFIDIKTYGAVGDGNSNPLSAVYGTLVEAQADYPLATELSAEFDAEALKKAVDENIEGSEILFSPGTYLIDGITISKTVTLRGQNATILNTVNDVCIRISQDNFRIVDLKFQGSGKSVSQSLNFAFSISSAKNWLIYNCSFTEFAQAACRISNTHGSAGTTNKVGGNIIACDFYNNDTGLDLNNRGEYVNVIGGNYDNNNVAIYNEGGNNTIQGVNANFNAKAIEIASGSNNGHGSISNCRLNHNATALDIDGSTRGFTISATHVFASAINLRNSLGVYFDACLLEVTTFTLENLTGCKVQNCVFGVDNPTTIVDTSVGGGMRWFNNKTTEGQDLTPKTASYDQTHFDDVIFIDGSVPINMMPAQSWPDSVVTIKNTGTSSPTIETNGSETIDGNSNLTLSSGQVARVISDGINLYTL